MPAAPPDPPIPPFAMDDAMLFTSAVATGSFTAAAELHSITASGVSKAVSRLERALSVRLLLRTTRSLRLTEEGALFHERCEAALRLMDEAAEAATESNRSLYGVLRIGMPAELGTRVAAPQLAPFLDAHPGLSVQFVQMTHVSEFFARRVDCAVVIGAVDDPLLAGRPLGTAELAIVASPAYVKRHGRPRTFDDLAGHRLITLTSEDGTEQPWRFAAGAKAQVATRSLHGRLRTDLAQQAIAAALSDVGIAQVSLDAVRTELDAGRLLRLLENCSVDGPPAWIVYPAQRALPRRVRVLVDELTRDAGPPPRTARRASR